MSKSNGKNKTMATSAQIISKNLAEKLETSVQNHSNVSASVRPENNYF